MNEDDNNLQPWIEPELEARVVASVLGEASAFETADLERELAEKPELAIFKRRIEAIHGLVATASRPERPALRLSPERRRKLLETIGGRAPVANSKINVFRRPRPAWLTGWLLVRVAACVAMALLAATFLIPAGMGSRKRTAGHSWADESLSTGWDSLYMERQKNLPSAQKQALAGNWSQAREALVQFGTGNLLSTGITKDGAAAQTGGLQSGAARGKALLTVNSSDALTISGNVTGGGGGGLARNGTGTLTLSGGNTYSGVVANANAGTLTIGGSNGTRKIDTVNATLRDTPNTRRLTLGGDGTNTRVANGRTVVNGGTYVNGSNAVATLTLGATSLSNPEAPGAAPAGQMEEMAQREVISGDGKISDKVAGDYTISHTAGTGGFGGPAPFTDMSPAQSGVDGSYQATARGDASQAPVQEQLATAATAAPSNDLEERISALVAAAPAPAAPAVSDQVSEGVELPASAAAAAEASAAPSDSYNKTSTADEAGNTDRMTGGLNKEAEDFYSSGRYDLATKRYEQTLNADPNNIAARKGLEKVESARETYRQQAYNETRSRVLWQADSGWSLPVRKYSAGKDEASDAARVNLPQAQQSAEVSDYAAAANDGAERSKDVHLLSAPQVTTKSGAKATINIVHEFKYPTESDSPQVPQTVADNFAPAATAPRSGSTAISSNSMDGLFFGATAKPVEPSAQDEIAGAPAGSPAAEASYLGKADDEKKFDGFINYGSPIYTGGEKSASAKPNAANQPVFSTSRQTLTAQVDAGWELPVTKFDVGAGQVVTSNHGTAAINRKLDEIRIPKINFREATVREALDFIKMRAAALDTKESDPNKRGINIVLKLDPTNQASADARITLQLTDVSLGQALGYIATAASLKTKVDPYAVAIVPIVEGTDVLITKEYKVSPEFVSDFSGKFNAKDFLEASGTIFPPGASASYLPNSGKLIVRNTQDNLDLVDQLVEADIAKQNELEKKADLAAAQSEIKSSDQPFSTFSLHVADVSFQLAKDAFARGEMPDPDQIRAEEFYNAFDYGDPAPAAGEEVSFRIEQSAHPFLQQRNLVRIAMKVGAVGRNASQPLRLTILLDTSGSMEREDRAASVRKALESLASLLGPNDRVTLIGFARQPRLLAENVPGDQAGKLVEIAQRTPSEGGTNLEEALSLATELAGNQYLASAQNRVVLLTDGAANLGNANPAQLAKDIEKLRQRGVAFDACGVGADGLNDSILEALTRKGDGRYYFLNKPADADAGFAKQLAGAFHPAAENVKLQVHFNPRRVGKYRLLGFEQHRLKKEDFRNDKVDAAELSAEEAAVAVYQVEPLPDGEGELGEVFVRFHDPASGEMVERSWTMPYDAQAPSFDKASPSMQLAGVAAMIAEKLRGGPAADAVDLKSLAPVINDLRSEYPNQERVRDLIRMFEQLSR